MPKDVNVFAPTNTRRGFPILIFAVATLLSSMSLALDVSWYLTWGLLFLCLTSEFAVSTWDILKKRYSIDSALFALGALIFIVAEPVLYLCSGHGFPNVDDREYSSDEVANLAGLVVCVFCLCFYVGRFSSKQSMARRKIVTSGYPSLNVTRTPYIMVVLSTSVLAFALNGESVSLYNLLATLSARASGYVAFASSGLGSENPLLVMLAQSIPVAVILTVLAVADREGLRRVLYALAGVASFVAYAMLGGRSGLMMVLVSVGLYFLVARSHFFSALKIGVLAIATVGVLAFQINYRTTGDIQATDFDKSPLTGSALNREIAFIVDTYGKSAPYYGGSGVVSRALLAIPDTLVLFVTNPIPRKIWPDKPVDPSFGPYNMIRHGFTGFGAESNITPTIPGRFYMNYGLVGVVEIGLVLGVIWGFSNRLIVQSLVGNADKLLLGSVLSATLFSAYRDLAPGKFYPIIILAFLVWVGKIVSGNVPK